MSVVSDRLDALQRHLAGVELQDSEDAAVMAQPTSASEAVR
jgi:hypothetical protein